jgi:hypothetical protein
MRSTTLVTLRTAGSILLGCVGVAFAGTIIGTAEDDTLLGTSEDDVILSLAGDDTVIGSA